jgi:hypothetical protein
LYRISERTHHHVALREALSREFGGPPKDKNAKATEFEERMRSELKAKSDAIEERMGERLEELARAGAKRKGSVPKHQEDSGGEGT